ncbi:MAG: DUF2073 domain-containing protein [Thermoplasmata archaeon HGW-Thermoplasmata-1]|nr:MAG: DUF2073 domain-containing protein [Thermoplasmata archaeon HGW-Thermoplasmata-1]
MSGTDFSKKTGSQCAPEDIGTVINLVSKQKMEGMSEGEKIRFILDEVECGKILILEEGLTPQEQTKLIETTMSEIDTDTFIGIEMESYVQETERWWQKLLKLSNRPRMTVIGPAQKLKTVHKDSQVIQAVVISGKRE